MQDRTNVWTSVALVALVGGVVTALLYTERGRQVVNQLEHALDDFGQSLQHLRGTIQKAGTVAAEGIDVAVEGMGVVSQLVKSVGDQRRGAGTLH